MASRVLAWAAGASAGIGIRPAACNTSGPVTASVPDGQAALGATGSGVRNQQSTIVSSRHRPKPAQQRRAAERCSQENDSRDTMKLGA